MRKLLLILTFAFILTTTAYSASPADTETGMRQKPLLDKLAAYTKANEAELCKKYPDMPDHWSVSHLSRANFVGLIGGYPDSTMKPDNNVTVAEYITMIIKAMGFTPGGGSVNWYDSYVNSAISEGIIEKDEFTDYDAYLTRGQMAKICVKAALKSDFAPSDSLLNYIRQKVTDYPYIHNATKNFVLQGYAMGLFGGDPSGRFNDKNDLTRGEAAVTALKVLDKAGRGKLDLSGVRTIQLKDLYGTEFTVYEPSKKEIFDAILALKESYTKTSGYSRLIYAPMTNYVSSAFDTDVLKETNYNIDMSIAISISEDEDSLKNPYGLTILNADSIKLYHREAVVGLFKYLFEYDYDKAMAQFDRFVELGVNRAGRYDESYTFNRRTFLIYKDAGRPTFSIQIYAK